MTKIKDFFINNKKAVLIVGAIVLTILIVKKYAKK
jgi:hypothetical protein